MEITPKADKLPCSLSSPCYSVESSPSEFKEYKHRSGLSASLRERLKRTRRSFISPLSVAKRLCVDNEEEEEDSKQVSADTSEIHSEDAHRTKTMLGSEGQSAPPQPTQISSEDLALQLRKEVKEKTETLRRLKMVKMYRSKNDLMQLQTLIDKWRSCAQAALYELQSEIPIEGRKAELSELVDLFGLDDSILRFDRAEGDFTT
ncbi:PREDICTED: swi5-dependent recombination DNA repair protein 1 homolog [Cyprinodon variegatus]|uniref:swi5-dependent recombination DNA repair protein 1 homolog n=1 Tax=Cyprinodon variegatus TaxID=28743 RepID=UPI0007426F55|nr:PREDICTED: swi5-dependent recombination DNA repair protein 1 homolog [Cyprinodon variegatus]XP_015252460.1 PREDICTED: swi5-dependent recombination DNA repair protein 1 homolog [Cyprinodon variegatus]